MQSSSQDQIIARLAVIESQMKTLLSELASIRKHIPCTLVEHTEHISCLERSMRTVQWVGGVFAATLIGAFLSHILGG